MATRRASKTTAETAVRGKAPLERAARRRPARSSSPAPAAHDEPRPSAPTASLLPLFPGFVPDYEWVLGLVEVPRSRAKPRGDAEPREPAPVVALFLEAGSAVVIHVERPSPITPSSVGAAVCRALERGEALGLGKPTRIRIGAPDQVQLLGEAARHGIEVVVGPAPEVDDVLRSPAALRSLVAPVTELDVYRGASPISDTRLAAFFAAATGFRELRAWKALGGTALRLRVPALGLAEGAMVPLRARGRGGVLLLREPETIERALASDEATREAAAWPRCLAMRFVAPSRLGRARRRELLDLSFASRLGPHPVLVPTADDGRRRPVEDHDYALATAALLATRRFLGEFGTLLHKPSLRALMARYEQVLELGSTHRVLVDLGLVHDDPRRPDRH